MDAKTQHYFSEVQQGQYNPKLIKSVIRGRIIELFTAPGMFSPRKLDLGSKLLINECRIIDGQYVLDLGCGYGAVGISLSLFFPTSKFLLVDINERALKLAKKNKEFHRLDNVEIKKSNSFYNIPKDELFDIILLNPPQSAGKDLCQSMIKDSFSHLRSGGSLQLVARQHKGGKSLSQYMSEIFGNIEVIGKKSGYRIYLSEKK